MAVEIAVWTAEIAGLASALKNALETVDKLRSRGRGKIRGDELDPVKKNLEDVSKKINNVKNIGGLLGYYGMYSEKAHDIRTMSDKIGELALNLPKNPPDSDWRSIKTMFGAVSEAYTEFINLKTGGRWLDDKDRGSISLCLIHVTDKYNTAKEDLDKKRSKDFEKSISQLKKEALDLEKLFDGSIRDMLEGLISI